MSNRARNWEAVNINRAIMEGRATSVVEAAVNWFIHQFFGIDVSRPPKVDVSWRPHAR